MATHPTGKRPPTGILTVAVPLELLAWMDRDAERRGIAGRTAYVNYLLRAMRAADSPAAAGTDS